MVHIRSGHSLQAVQVTHSIAQVRTVWASRSDIVRVVVPSSVG